MKKTVTLKMNFNFEILNGCIAWSGSSGKWVDSKGKTLNSLDFPDSNTLLLWYLGRCVMGKNGKNELSIVGADVIEKMEERMKKA